MKGGNLVCFFSCCSLTFVRRSFFFFILFGTICFMLGLNSLFEIPVEFTIIISLPIMNFLTVVLTSGPCPTVSGLVSSVNNSGSFLLGVISTADSLTSATDLVLFFGFLTEDGIRSIASVAVGRSFGFFDSSFLMKLFNLMENFSGIVSNSLCWMLVPN